FRETGAAMEKLSLGGPLDFISPYRLARLMDAQPEEKIVIHVHNFKDARIAGIAKRLCKRKDIRLVCTRHLVRNGKRGAIWKRIYEAIDRLIFVSDVARRNFLSTNPPVVKDRICVVHNSIVIPKTYAGYMPAAREDKEPPVILYCGRIDPEKGIELLMEALGELRQRDWKLRIVGTGNPVYTASLRRRAEQAGISDRIEWAGFRENVYEEIRKADICVAPSIVKESFGLNIIEFMSQGRPTVTTDNGAQPEIITDGYDGMLVPPADPQAIARTLELLMKDDVLRSKIGRNAAATFSNRFSYDRFFTRILNIYKEL
ncbi:MAG: glycosyltransferase family 4 protein, partial [Muribaculaceae bacterium]|nr:glycosyltransferase family 4 protein [Muribaculaceae bacterium]